MNILNIEEIKTKSSSLKCLANEHRLGIVIYLKSRKCASVGEIADNMKTTLSFKATSKHLAILVKGGVLVCTPDNPFMIYSLSPNTSKFLSSLISIL